MSSISSCSFRLFTTRFHYKTPLCKTNFKQISITRLSFFKPISFESLPTKPPSSTSSSAPSNSTSLQPIEELPPKLQEIVKLFQSVQEPKAKYEQLMFYGKNLKPLDTQFKTRENKVEGCVSQVWVRAFFDHDKNVVFEADSDSVLTKGLAALLVLGLSGRPVEEILRVSPDFVVLLGLQQSLTPSRNNGFLNMLKLMQKKALTLYVEAEKGGELVEKLSSDYGGVESSIIGRSSDIARTASDTLSSRIENPVRSSNSESKVDGSIEGSNVGLSSEVDGKHLEYGGSAIDEIEVNSNSLGSRGKRIKEKLQNELSPVELEVEDISYQHAGHAGVKGSHGETHFNVKVVSKEFEGKSLVKRHRIIYNLLQEELQTGLHALAIVAKTPSEVNGR
ncbi:SufE-like protein chloroplastic-like [Quillaja saponaria]|uniref:SufE-like protein chloroplastic-like n=1 Tax=Quillaja saponaria TaxID=32244 RepID=A0AAD7LQY1_QUISA|nr:SufE-like protein chloroplastic-like [Quillaja saponaria]